MLVMSLGSVAAADIGDYEENFDSDHVSNNSFYVSSVNENIEKRSLADSSNDLNVISEDLAMVYGDGSVFDIVVSDKNGPVSGVKVGFNLDKESRVYYRTTNDDGVASITINRNPGVYTINSVLPDGTKFSNRIDIRENKNSIASKDISMFYGSGDSFEVTVKNPFGKAVPGVKVGFNLDKESRIYYRTTNENGVASIAINRNPGVYTINSVLPDGTKSSNRISIMENRNSIVSKDISMFYGSGDSFSVVVRDANGDAVSGVKVAFNLDKESKTYYRTTDEKGVASITINRSPGVYTINSALPDGKKVSNKIDIRVNRNSIVSSNLYMKKGDGSSFAVTVRDAFNRPVSNVVIGFNIKGESKTYYRTSNGAGVASIAINRPSGAYEIISSCGDARASNYIYIDYALPFPMTAQIYLDTDNIITKAKDTQMLKDCENQLKKLGFNVVNLNNIGPNYHISDVTSGRVKDNSCLFAIFGGLCAGTFRDMASQYYQKELEKRNIKVILGFLAPPVDDDLDTLKWLPRAHDDNFSPSRFKGLDNPGQYLKDNGFLYVYGSSGVELANNLLLGGGGLTTVLK